MKRNHVFKIAFALTLTSFFSLFVTGVTFSWFIKDNKIAFDGEIGTTQANYYESGDGSESTPFIISNPRHLYNLAWLQYLGTYNQVDTTTGKVPTYYFEIKNDIDMKGYVLPPIGTESNPFLSNFNANNCTISNLTISNVIDDDYIETYPSVVIKKDFNSQKAIVGFFGVIGTYNSSDSTITYDTSKNEVKNLYLDNLTITSKKDNLLIGVFAGYVNGTIDNCGVHYVKMNIKGATTKLDSFDNVSKFTLIGDYNKNSYSYDQDGSGQTQDWGGSIDTTALVKRLYYIAGVSNVNSTTYSSNEPIDFDGKTTPSYNKDKYNVYFRSVNDGSHIWKSDSGTNQYLYKGTYLPLNIDTSIAFAGKEIDATASGVSNWKTTEYYKNHISEYDLISDSNTGYIVGGGIPTNQGGSPTGTAAKYIFLRKEINFKTNLKNSISSSEYNNDDVKIYTIDTVNSSTSTQITSSTGFQRYSTVKTNFDAMMAVTKSYCFAVRFQSINATDSSNWSDKVTVKINGNEKSNYQFLNSAINFTVNKPGYITVIISSFMGVGTKMFDLFKIDRNSDYSINKVTQINKIYGASNSGTYYYDDTSKSSNLLFNFENAHTLNGYSLYYFEIPVNAGDYAIGKYSENEGTDSSTGYLNYLDIGANAEGDSDTRTELSNFDFVTKDSNSLTKIKTKNNDGTYSANNDYSKSNVTFKIGDTTGDTTLAFRRIDQDTNGVLYYQSVDSILTPSGTGKNNEASDDNCNSKKS